MKKLVVIVNAVFMVMVVLSGVGWAVDQKNTGCGLGSIVIGANGGQISAATTNGSSASQLFGITSGTSNCAEDGVAMNEGETNSFAEANFESLKQEMAQGQGDNLQVLASLMGCDAHALGSAARSNYGSIFDRSDVTAPVMLERVEATGACSQR